MKRKFFEKYELLLEIYKMQIIEKKYVDGWTFNKIRDYLYSHNKNTPSSILYSNLYNYIRKEIIKVIDAKGISKRKNKIRVFGLKNLTFTLSEKGIEIVKTKIEKEKKSK